MYQENTQVMIISTEEKLEELFDRLLNRAKKLSDNTLSDNLLFLEDAAKEVGKGEQTVKNWYWDGLLINYAPGRKGSHMKFDKDELRDALRAQHDHAAKAELRSAIKRKHADLVKNKRIETCRPASKSKAA